MKEDLDIVAELQHRHRILIHDIKGIYSLLNNQRRGPFKDDLSRSKEMIEMACEKLERIWQ